ncbi:MAG: hypothetical protein AAB296_01925, partial [Candidatus Desantisbacteria bacterium]
GSPGSRPSVSGEGIHSARGSKQVRLKVITPTIAMTYPVYATFTETCLISGTTSSTIDVIAPQTRAAQIQIGVKPGCSTGVRAKTTVLLGLKNTSNLEYSFIDTIGVNPAAGFVVLDEVNLWQDKGNGWVIINKGTNSASFSPNIALGGKPIAPEEELGLELALQNPDSPGEYPVTLEFKESSGRTWTTTATITVTIDTGRNYETMADFCPQDSPEIGAVSRLRISLKNNESMDYTSINQVIVNLGSFTSLSSTVDRNKTIGQGWAVTGI